MQKLVVLTGAGISAESGLATFRDGDGLWESFDLNEVATPKGWAKNPKLVQHFYNLRRAQLKEVEPNSAHFDLVKLEQKYDVDIITQNVDDLHERAGSKKVLHLHGELKKVRSTVDAGLVYNWESDLKLGDFCEKGSQLRPHIVWFGEAVPGISIAQNIVSTADVLVIIGTSLNVYPASGLGALAPVGCAVYLIDPNEVPFWDMSNLIFIKKTATEGTKELLKIL